MADFKDLFSIRSMVPAVEQWKEPGTFLLNAFFKEIKEHAARYVEIDFFNEKRRIAPFTLRNATGQKVETTGHNKFIWEPPYVKPRQDITPEDLQEALLGENPYSTVDPGMRFVEFRNKILFDLDRMITRREELMAMQCLFDKTIPITNENGDTIMGSIVFVRTTGLDFTVVTAWSNSSTATPVKDIRTASRLIAQNSGLSANIAIHGSTSADEFLACDEVAKYLDKQQFGVANLELAQVAQELGAQFLCEIEGIKHYRYDAWYIDPATGTETALIPAGKTLVGSTLARSIRHYGAIETVAVQSGLVRARRWPKFYDAANEDPEVYGVQLHSAPLPATHQPDAFSVLTT